MGKAVSQSSSVEDSPLDKIAIVDGGSGTFRLVIYGVTAEGKLTQHFTSKASCNLGDGVQKDGKLSQDSMDCAVEALKAFQAEAKKHGVSAFHFFATSAVRDAENQQDFLDRVKSETGLGGDVLSEKKEAVLASDGAMHDLAPQKKQVIADMGGSSLEIATRCKRKTKHPESLRLGRIPVSKGGEVYLNDEWERFSGKHPKEVPLHLVGGLWRGFAKAYLKEKYNGQDKPELHGYRIDKIAFLAFLEKLKGTDRETLKTQYKIREDRIEYIQAGIDVLEKLSNTLNPSGLVFSKYGVREGYVLQILEQRRGLSSSESKPAAEAV